MFQLTKMFGRNVKDRLAEKPEIPVIRDGKHVFVFLEKIKAMTKINLKKEEFMGAYRAGSNITLFLKVSWIGKSRYRCFRRNKYHHRNQQKHMRTEAAHNKSLMRQGFGTVSRKDEWILALLTAMKRTTIILVKNLNFQYLLYICLQEKDSRLPEILFSCLHNNHFSFYPINKQHYHCTARCIK